MANTFKFAARPRWIQIIFDQTLCYLVSGQVRFAVSSEEIICNPGDSWCFSGDEEHGAEALQDSVLVEVFSPAREDYCLRLCEG
jgi:quercetin dioxygenase-like cupin family protein